jgi:hypothetical protein
MANSADARRRAFRSRWVIVGIIAVLFLLVIGIVVAGASAADHAIREADKAMTTTIGHQKTVGGTLTAQPFRNIDFKGDNPDIAAAKSALATYEPQISGAQALVKADRARLLAAKQGVAGSVFTIPERATLDQRRHRVEAALTALQNAQRALDLYKKTADFAHPFFDAFAAMEAANRSITANDLAGAASQLKAAQDGVNKALDLAKRPAIPQQFERLLTSVNFLLTDMQGLINSAQAHDIAGVHDFLNRIDGALNGASEYDPKIVDDYMNQLYSPLRDAYGTNLRVAAGG